MAREIFKNLPDKTTPINASKLNGLFNGEEAMGSIVVDDVECNNSFNKENIIKGYGVNADGTLVANENQFFGNEFVEVKPNTQYTFGCETTVDRVVICEYDSSQTFIQRDIALQTNINTITTTSNTKYVKLSGMISVLGELQFEKGTATEYTPYKKFGYNSQESMGNIVVDDISCKNILDLSGFASRTTNGVTFTNNNDGSITINGTSTTAFGVSFADLKLKAGTYHLSLNATVPSDFYIWDRTSLQNILMKEATATLTKYYDNISLDTWINAGVTFNNVTIKPQLEKGDKATPFTQHKEFSNKETKGVSLWSGRAYEGGTVLTLSKSLEVGKIYVIEFWGLSGKFKSYETFVYTGHIWIQINYYSVPDNNGFRYRLEYDESAKTLTISNESTNNASNTAITNILEVTNSYIETTSAVATTSLEETE